MYFVDQISTHTQNFLPCRLTLGGQNVEELEVPLGPHSGMGWRRRESNPKLVMYRYPLQPHPLQPHPLQPHPLVNKL